VVGEKWTADTGAGILRRLGKSPREIGITDDKDGCPDIWELDNGDFAVIGADLSGIYAGCLPEGAVIGHGEKLVVIPRVTLMSAKPDIPDA
jgi:hypothetical protein